MAHKRIENGFDYQCSYTLGNEEWHTVIFNDSYEMRRFANNMVRRYCERIGFGIVCYKMVVMATDEALNMALETSEVPIVYHGEVINQ